MIGLTSMNEDATRGMAVEESVLRGLVGRGRVDGTARMRAGSEAYSDSFAIGNI